jgi:murein DD-endopeptidase MepM/ murein hydrolase activator NlpD
MKFNESHLEQSLPHRLRSRLRYKIPFTVSLLAVLAISSYGYYKLSVPETKKKECVAELIPEETQKEPEHDSVVNYIIKPDDTFETVMRQFEIEPSNWLAVAESAKDVHDLDTLKVGQSLRLSLKNNPGLVKLEYEYDDENILVVERSDNGFVARNDLIQYDIEVAQVGGEVTSSLFETASELGVSDGVIMEITNILAWQVDFVSDVRAGDSFQLLYEKRFRDGKYVDYGDILGVRFTNQGNDYWAVYFKDPEGVTGYYDLEGNSIKKTFLKSPLQYKYISSGYSGSRLHPVLKTYLAHEAIDYAAQAGTPVAAVGEGRVTYAGWKDGGDGIFVEIKHNDIYTTRYSHMQNIADSIKVGSEVKQNGVIGYVGSTGLSTGSHLQYAMLKNGEAVNPFTVDLPSGESVGSAYLSDYKSKAQEIINQLKLP